MKEKQFEQLNEVRSMIEELSQLQIDYWKTFSGVDIWQFWLVVITIIVPLIILFFFIDKSKALLLGFFGLNYHVWFAYVNKVGISMGLWEYPYQIVPFLPSFALDASLVPISFILLYQWTLNHNKNLYIYSVILSSFFAFVLKPLMVKFNFFHMFKDVNYVHLFLFYMAFLIASKIITNVFASLQEKKNSNT
jgi:hypothetical protein